MKEIITITSLLDGVSDFFITTEEISFSEKNRLLGKVWQILNEICPVSGTELSVSVPSQTLIDLGLVSKNAEEEIKGIIDRKEQDQSDEPQNRISFKRTGPDKITISKSYVSEELTESSFRKDKVMAEESILTKDEEIYKVSMKIKIDNIHIHDDGGRIWVLKFDQEGEEYEWKNMEPTASDLNRTLALSAEGLKPGCLGNKRLFKWFLMVSQNSALIEE